MSWIAACKICQEPVTVPEEVDRSESVCCPRCRAEFLSSEVPDEAGQQSNSAKPPPDVLPVEALFDKTSGPESSELQSEPSKEEEEEEEEEHSDELGPDTRVEQAEEFPDIDLNRGIQTDSDTVEPVAEAQEPPGPLEEEAESEDAAVDSEGLDVAPDDGASETATAEPEPSTHAPPEATDEAPPADEATESLDETLKTVGDTPAPAEATPAAPGHAESLRVRCPACEAEYRLSQVIVVSTGSRLGAAAAAAVAGVTAHSGAGESAGEGPALDVWARADSVPQIDLGEAAGAQVVSTEPGAFDFAQDNSDAADGSGSVAAARRERRRNQKSGLRAIMGPVFGGIAGLLIAYYLLNWIRGEAGNFLEIPLPGVPHTYKHSPDWFPDWMKPQSDSEEVGSEEFADAGEEESLARPDNAKEKPAVAKGREERGIPSTSAFGAGLAEATPPPERKEFPEGYVGLVEPPSYDADELGEALKTVADAVADPSDLISEACFGHWCRLAERVTFVRGESGGRQLGARRSAVRKLLEQLGSDEANLDKIGYQASALCASEHRDSNGILLAGTVTNTVSEGNAHGAQVELAASGQTILVANSKPLPAAADDSVLILGSIVDNPAENLVGFKTQKRFLVWSGMTIKLKK